MMLDGLLHLVCLWMFVVGAQKALRLVGCGQPSHSPIHARFSRAFIPPDRAVSHEHGDSVGLPSICSLVTTLIAIWNLIVSDRGHVG